MQTGGRIIEYLYFSNLILLSFHPVKIFSEVKHPLSQTSSLFGLLTVISVLLPEATLLNFNVVI